MSEKVKLLYVHSNTSLGGAPNSMLFTIQSLPTDKFDVSVLFLGEEGPGSELFLEKGIQVDYLSGIVNFQHADNAIIHWLSKRPLRPITQFIGMLNSVNQVKKYLQEKEYDLVHINTSVMLSVGIACRQLRIPVVWHIREPIAKGLFGFRRYIVRNIIKVCASRIIAISKVDGKRFGRSDKLSIIYNFVDLKRFNYEIEGIDLHKELSILPDSRMILMLGGVVHSKGADVLLDSVKYIINECSKIHFVVAGYPPGSKVRKRFWLHRKSVADKCIEIIKRDKLDDIVSFIGLRTDIPELLASSDILVWPATVPHFSRPIIEAQVMGVPCVATDFDSSREIIEDKKTGLLFQNRNSRHLADAIIKLLKDRELYSSIADQSNQQAIQKFDGSSNINKILDVYNSIILDL